MEVEAVVIHEPQHVPRALPDGQEQDWRAAAACLDSDPDLFFPISTKDSWSRELAFEHCRPCQVREECLGVALADPRLTGIWGGTDEIDRQRLRANRRRRSEETT
jgi:WhiB family redox-sensing transcriptional regulator